MTERAEHGARPEVRQGAAALFDGPGEMRALCRAHDWAATPLGPVEGWPQILRTAAGLVLGSAFPMILLWGPELVQITTTGTSRSSPPSTPVDSPSQRTSAGRKSGI